MITVMGQITSCAVVDIQTIVRHVVRETGYADSRFGFCADDCAVVILVDRQSEDINAGVSCSLEKRMRTLLPVQEVLLTRMRQPVQGIRE